MDYFTAPRDFEGQAVFVIGGGPSIKGFDFERLRGRNIIAVNNAGLDLVPWCDVLLWADKRWLEWNHDRLGQHTGKYKISRKQPHIATGFDIKYMRFWPRKLSQQANTLGGWCGGSSAINLAYLMGAKVIVLMGFDMRDFPISRWREGNYHDDHQLPPVEGQRRNKFVPTIEAMEPDLTSAGVLVLNTCFRSGFRAFPFADIEDLLAMDNLAAAEREKYVAIWQREEYRRVSPGMMECERAFMICDMEAGQSLIDFGAGPARATKWFADKGLEVVAVDFAPNARETDVPFVEACLWDLPDDLKQADFGFCTDVAEHLPREKVDDVMAGIRARVRTACYFRIATRPDVLGKLINKPLHLTIENGDWWRRKVEEFFDLVDVIENNGRDVVLLARP